METGPDGRRRIDVAQWPRWTRVVLALAIVLVIGGAALWVGDSSRSPVLPLSALIPAIIAFAWLAWRAQHPR